MLSLSTEEIENSATAGELASALNRLHTCVSHGNEPVGHLLGGKNIANREVEAALLQHFGWHSQAKGGGGCGNDGVY